jgi:nucleoside-triphosphatase THEP1
MNLKGSVNVTARVSHYFAGGNTAIGFFSLVNSCLQDLDKVILLIGAPGTGKSTLLKELASRWTKTGNRVDLIHASSDHDSIEGIILPDLKAGIIGGALVKAVEPRAHGVIEEYASLDEGMDREKLNLQKNNIIQLNEEIRKSFSLAYDAYAEALKVHDDWEKIYIQSLNFQKANKLTEQLLQRLFENKNSDRNSIVLRRFLGAATPIGAVDFVPDLTEGLSKRYFLKGRPGSGKSTMLKKIAAEGKKRGFDVEIYHCGFDPKSLDMIIIRELGFAIFDSTAPHEYFPSREGDEIIDLYGTIIEEGTDEMNAERIEFISRQYKEKMNHAKSFLAKAKSLNDELENIYSNAMDFEHTNRLTENIHEQLQKISARRK